MPVDTRPGWGQIIIEYLILAVYGVLALGLAATAPSRIWFVDFDRLKEAGMGGRRCW